MDRRPMDRRPTDDRPQTTNDRPWTTNGRRQTTKIRPGRRRRRRRQKTTTTYGDGRSTDGRPTTDQHDDTRPGTDDQRPTDQPSDDRPTDDRRPTEEDGRPHRERWAARPQRRARARAGRRGLRGRRFLLQCLEQPHGGSLSQQPSALAANPTRADGKPESVAPRTPFYGRARALRTRCGTRRSRMPVDMRWNRPRAHRLRQERAPVVGASV